MSDQTLPPDDLDDLLSGLTGEAILTDGARTILLSQKTHARFICGEPRCVYSVLTWEAELPSISCTTRAWPKCPEKHRARFVAPLQQIAT
jgi:hypothetical protein